MGRPSIAGERTEQILDAFEECIRKYGLKESSIPRIAAEAGIRHSMIRHYIGNRESLIEAMVKRFTERYLWLISEALASGTSAPETAVTSQPDTSPDTAPEATPKTAAIPPLESAVDRFFGETVRLHAENKIFTEFFAAAPRDGFIREQLCTLYERITDMISSALSFAYNEAGRERADSVSYSLLSIWIGHSVLVHLGFRDRKNASATASESAKKMIRDLGLMLDT